MKMVGLTGGIGSGKTFVANVFKWMGIPCYHSDPAARSLMNTDKHLKTNLLELLGAEAYTDNALNRKYIAERIFNNPVLLENINNLVHPAVRKDFKKWAEMQEDIPFVINEAALFVENGSYQSFDYLITVLCPLQIRIERTIHRDGSSEEIFYQRYNNQSSDQEKIAKSHFLIYNDYTESLIQQCVKIRKTIINS